jgi:hypothetical protein
MPAARVAARAAAARCGEGTSRPARAGKAAAQTQGRHVALGKAVRGWQVHCTWPARAAARRVEETESRGLEVDEGGAICNFLKV